METFFLLRTNPLAFDLLDMNRANLDWKHQFFRDSPYWVHIKVLIHTFSSSRVQPDSQVARMVIFDTRGSQRFVLLTAENASRWILMALKGPIFGVAAVQKSKELSIASLLNSDGQRDLHVSEERQDVAFTSMR
jgi:hypothetical protein